MQSSNLRRSLVVGTLALLGAMTAFLAGARAGAVLDGHSNMTLGHVPISATLQPASLRP